MSGRYDFGRRLAALIERGDATQAEIARKSGLSTAAICYIVGGKREPSLNTARKISGAFGPAEELWLLGIGEREVRD